MDAPLSIKSIGSQVVRLYEDGAVLSPHWLELGRVFSRVSEGRLRLLDTLARVAHFLLLFAACVALVLGAYPIIGALRDWVHNGSMGKISPLAWGFALVGLLGIPLALRALADALTTPVMTVFDKRKGEVRFVRLALEFLPPWGLPPWGLPWMYLTLTRVPFDNIISLKLRPPDEALSGHWELWLRWRQLPGRSRWAHYWWERLEIDVNQTPIAKITTAAEEAANFSAASELALALNSVIGRQVVEGVSVAA